MNPPIVCTLGIITEHNRILLGWKKRGFGQGRYNGFGGKVEPGETIANAARREILEETGLTVKKIRLFGVLDFTFKDNTPPLKVHVYLINNFVGQITETEEMRPQWFSLDAIPYSQMWADDIYWLPLLLAGQQFRGHFIFQDHNTLLTYHLKELALIKQSWH